MNPNQAATLSAFHTAFQIMFTFTMFQFDFIPTTFTFPMFDPKTFTIFNNLGAAIKGLCTAAAPNRTPRQGTLAERF